MTPIKVCTFNNFNSIFNIQIMRRTKLKAFESIFKSGSSGEKTFPPVVEFQRCSKWKFIQMRVTTRKYPVWSEKQLKWKRKKSLISQNVLRSLLSNSNEWNEISIKRYRAIKFERRLVYELPPIFSPERYQQLHKFFFQL